MDSRTSSLISSDVEECSFLLHEDGGERHLSYRQLITQIADSLDKDHVEKIVFLYELPDKMKQDTPLHVLDYCLHQRRGSDFSERNLAPLKSLLQNINKEELISTKVEPFEQKYWGRPPSNSMPAGVVNPKPSSKKRSNSYHYGQKHKDVNHSLLKGPPFQETSTSSLCGGNLPSIPDEPIVDMNTFISSPLESQSACSDSYSHSAVNMLSSQLQNAEQHTHHTTQLVDEECMTSSERCNHLQCSGRKSRQSLVPLPNLCQRHYSTQSLPQQAYYDGYHDTGRRYSLAHPETLQQMNHNSLRHRFTTRPTPQYAPAAMNTTEGQSLVVNKRKEVRPLPFPHDSSPWYFNNSSVDSMHDRHGHASYSSGFASSGEMLHHPSQVVHEQSIPSRQFTRPLLGDSRTCVSEGHSQSSVHQYPPHTAVPEDKMSHHSFGHVGHQFFTRNQSRLVPSRSEHLSPYGDYTQREGFVDPEMLRSERQIQNRATFGSTSYQYSSEASANFNPNRTVLQREPCAHAQSNHDIQCQTKVIGEGITFTPKPQSREKEQLLKNSENDLIQEKKVVNYRHRSYSETLDQKGKSKKRKSLSSLHSDQLSNGMLSPSSLHSTRHDQRHSLQYATIDSSSSDSSPSTGSMRFAGQNVIVRTSKPYHQSFLSRTKTLKPEQELEWKVKMGDINKLIYHPKHMGKYLPCPWKIAVEGKDGLKIVLQLRLHPFGKEEDENVNVTIEVVIDHPKTRRLHSEAKVLVGVSAVSDKTKTQLCKTREERKDANLSYFYLKGFISHQHLKESTQYLGNEKVVVTVKAELISPQTCKFRLSDL